MSEQGEASQQDTAPVVTNPPTETLSNPRQPQRSSLGLKIAGALASVGLLFGADKATGGHGVNTVGEAVGNVTQGVEALVNPRPFDGKEIEEGKITKAMLVVLHEGEKEEPPVIREKPSKKGEEVKSEEYQERGINIEGEITGKRVFGGKFEGQFGSVADKGGKPIDVPFDSEGNDNNPGGYGSWFEIEGKDHDGNPTKYYVSWNFVKEIETSSATATDQPVGK